MLFISSHQSGNGPLQDGISLQLHAVCPASHLAAAGCCTPCTCICASVCQRRDALAVAQTRSKCSHPTAIPLLHALLQGRTRSPAKWARWGRAQARAPPSMCRCQATLVSDVRPVGELELHGAPAAVHAWQLLVSMAGGNGLSPVKHSSLAGEYLSPSNPLVMQGTTQPWMCSRRSWLQQHSASSQTLSLCQLALMRTGETLWQVGPAAMAGVCIGYKPYSLIQALRKRGRMLPHTAPCVSWQHPSKG